MYVLLGIHIVSLLVIVTIWKLSTNEAIKKNTRIKIIQ